MYDELEEALRELEAKLPDLRHLIIESGGVLTASPEAQRVAARLLRSVAVSDELASQLRLLLLSGSELVIPASPAPPMETPVVAPPVAEPILTADLEDSFATSEPLTESDAALLEALGLAPDTHTVFGEEEAHSVLSAEGSFVDNLSNEDLDHIETVMGIEEQVEALGIEIQQAKADGDEAKVQMLLSRQRALKEQVEQAKRVLEAQSGPKKRLQELDDLLLTPEEQQETEEELRDLERRLGISPAEEIPDRDIPYAEFWKEYEPVLQDAVYFYLENASETATVVLSTHEQAERVWNASRGEASRLEIIASIAALQCELLLPRKPEEPARRLPTTRQLFAHLETYRFERNVKELEDEIERLEADAREDDRDVSAEVAERRLRLERMIASFYNRRLHLDDDDEFSGGAIGSKIDPPDPVRDPGSGRTFDEALAAARNP